MSYEIPNNESRARKFKRDIDTTRHLARFASTSGTQNDTSAFGLGSFSRSGGTKLGPLVLDPLLHYICIEFNYTTTTGTLVIGSVVSTNVNGWKGRYLHSVSSTRGVFEPMNATVFSSGSNQNLSATGWTGTFTSATGNVTTDKIVLQSTASVIVDSFSGSPTIRTIYGARNDGQTITIIPKDGKTLTFTGADNIDISSDVTVADNNISILQFHNQVINGNTITNNKWKIIASGSGATKAIQNPCRLATTANNLTHPFVFPSTIDGVSLVVNDRILVKNQSTTIDNGIYKVGAITTGTATLVRVDEMVNLTVVEGSFLVAVQEGTTNADTVWMLTSNNVVTVGTSPMTFINITASGGDNLGNHIATTSLRLNDNVLFFDTGLTSQIFWTNPTLFYNVGPSKDHEFWIDLLTAPFPTFSITSTSVENNVRLNMNQKEITNVDYITLYASGGTNPKIDNSSDGKTINIQTNGNNRVNISENSFLNGTLELFGVQAGTQAPATFKTVNISTATNTVSIGELAFDGNNFSGTRLSYGRIVCDSKATATNSEKGTLGIYLKDGTASPASLKFLIDSDGSLFYPDMTFNDSVTVNNGLTVFNGATIDNSSGPNITTTSDIFGLQVGGSNVLTVDRSGTNNIMTYISVGNDVPQFVFYRNDTTPVSGDVVGVLRFNGNDWNTLNATTYAQIVGIATDVNNGSEDGQIEFSTKTAGGAGFTTTMTMDGSSGVIVPVFFSASGAITSITSGSIFLGDASTDIITVSGTFNSHFRVQSDNAWELGSSTAKLSKLWGYELNFASSNFYIKKHSGTNELDLAVPSTTNTIDMYFGGNFNYAFGYTTFQIGDATNIVLGTGSGTKIGTSTTQKIGFWNATPVTKPTVTGSRGGNAALADLLTELATMGLITNSTTA